MRRLALIVLALLVVGCGKDSSAPPAAKPPNPLSALAGGSDYDPDFDLDARAAMQALSTPEGTAYDEQLGAYLVALPEYSKSIKACTAASPGKQTVAGFVRFDNTGAYTVVLRPKGAFADCIAKFLEGREPPKPPRVPYLNPLSFTTEP